MTKHDQEPAQIDTTYEFYATMAPGQRFCVQKCGQRGFKYAARRVRKYFPGAHIEVRQTIVRTHSETFDLDELNI